MAVPHFPGKIGKKAMVTPAGYRAYLERIGRGPDFEAPEGVVLCYQPSLLKHVRGEHGTVRCKRDYSFLELLPETGRRLAVTGRFGIGAPAAATILEEIIALGVRRFVSVGTAGSLQKDVEVGAVVVCERAIRDEGTSHHYLEADREAVASAAMTEALKEALGRRGVAFHAGVSWTIDAPYRETVEEARHYQAEGVLSVEMEAAALFAVAEFRGVELGAMFTISDSLADLVWRPEFHRDEVAQGLETLFAAAREALLGES